LRQQILHRFSSEAERIAFYPDCRVEQSDDSSRYPGQSG
jgi:hypothetical protein